MKSKTQDALEIALAIAELDPDLRRPQPRRRAGGEDHGPVKRVAGYRAYPVAEAFWDARRSVKPGEMLSLETLVEVIEVFEGLGPTVTQAAITVAVAELRACSTDRASAAVSKALLFMRATGLARPRYKRGRSWLWTLMCHENRVRVAA